MIQYAWWALLFGLAYAQAPLYYSNQNQYFLHGLADAGRGQLHDDWLANTADPTPAFSFLVNFTASFLHEYAFHFYYLGLLGIYAASLLAIFSYLAGDRDTVGRRLAFVVAVTLVHCAFVRWGSYRLLGADYAWYAQAGLAGQYALGAMFQPSTFGVLLIASIALFVHGLVFWSVTVAVTAALMHATYVLPAGMLILAYQLVLGRRGQWRYAFGVGLWGLVLVAPMLIFASIQFRPTSEAEFAEAQRLLVHLRIPHHCLPRLWCDGVAWGQIGWVALALLLVRKSALAVAIGVPFAIAAGLTLLQVATASDAIALLFPWRISAILVPIATAVILSRLVLICSLPSPALVVGHILLIALAIAGPVLVLTRQGFQTNDDELPLYEFVRTHRQPGDVYLLPMKVPDLAKTVRGSFSSDWKPVAARQADVRLIPIDFQRFRLATETPIFVDFKSIPYRDVEVLEWRRRLFWNQEMYRDRDWNQPDFADELRREGITHVVTTRHQEVKNERLKVAFEDANYRVFHLGRMP